jgi:hypothetical protein
MALPYLYYPNHHTHQADLNPGQKNFAIAQKHEGIKSH